MTPTATTSNAAASVADELEYVTLRIGEQLFGLPIGDVHEVFAAHQITPVPLAPHAVRGLLNLRGRVVTAICLRTILNLPETAQTAERMALGVEVGGETFALLVDQIGDIMRVPSSTLEPNPIHMNADWLNLSHGVHRLETSILVVLELDRIIGSESLAA